MRFRGADGSGPAGAVGPGEEEDVVARMLPRMGFFLYADRPTSEQAVFSWALRRLRISHCGR